MEGTPSSRQNAPGKELEIPQSAEDFLDSFLQEAELGILRAAEEMKEQKEEARRSAKINAHYRKMAAEALKRLWTLCGNETGHRFNWIERDNVGNIRQHSECKFCGRPQGKIGINRSYAKIVKNNLESAITTMSTKLRKLDQKAGLEYIP